MACAIVRKIGEEIQTAQLVSSGWTGNECQLVITPEPPSSVCSLMAGGHLVSLNSVHTTFFGHGEFVLLGQSLISTRIHVHQVSCNQDRTRCISGIAIKTKSQLVTVTATESEDIQISVNAEKTKLSNIVTRIGKLILIKKRE